MVLAYPEQTCHAQIDLINQRQVPVPFAILDLVDAHSVDSPECAVLQAKGDDMFHRVEDLFP
jgi:hypothetical protein